MTENEKNLTAKMENKNYIIKKSEEIKNHFANITEEEFEKNLINAGYGEIQSLAELN